MRTRVWFGAVCLGIALLASFVAGFFALQTIGMSERTAWATVVAGAVALVPAVVVAFVRGVRDQQAAIVDSRAAEASRKLSHRYVLAVGGMSTGLALAAIGILGIALAGVGQGVGPTVVGSSVAIVSAMHWRRCRRAERGGDGAR